MADTAASARDNENIPTGEEIAWAKSQDMPELAADLTRKLLDL